VNVRFGSIAQSRNPQHKRGHILPFNILSLASLIIRITLRYKTRPFLCALAARRARALGVGLLAGGYGQDELERAGAYRVYDDPADLLRHLDEVCLRTTD